MEQKMRKAKDWSLWVSIAFISICILGVIGVGIAASQPKQPQQGAEAPPVCQVDAGKLLEHINAERSRLGAPQLQIDPTLATAAKYKLDNLIAEKYFSHKMANGDEWFKYVRSLGVNATVSEDLGVNDYTPERSWQEFKDSPNHYKSLTNPQFTRVGISAQCTDYVQEKAVEPGDEQYIGSKITDLTVVTLAANEPPKPQQPQQVQSNYTPRQYYNPPTTTTCTHNNYNGYFDATTRCTTY